MASENLQFSDEEYAKVLLSLTQDEAGFDILAAYRDRYKTPHLSAKTLLLLANFDKKITLFHQLCLTQNGQSFLFHSLQLNPYLLTDFLDEKEENLDLENFFRPSPRLLQALIGTEIGCKLLNTSLSIKPNLAQQIKDSDNLINLCTTQTGQVVFTRLLKFNDALKVPLKQLGHSFPPFRSYIAWLETTEEGKELLRACLEKIDPDNLDNNEISPDDLAILKPLIPTREKEVLPPKSEQDRNKFLNFFREALSEKIKLESQIKLLLKETTVDNFFQSNKIDLMLKLFVFTSKTTHDKTLLKYILDDKNIGHYFDKFKTKLRSIKITCRELFASLIYYINNFNRMPGFYKVTELPDEIYRQYSLKNIYFLTDKACYYYNKAANSYYLLDSKTFDFFNQYLEEGNPPSQYCLDEAIVDQLGIPNDGKNLELLKPLQWISDSFWGKNAFNELSKEFPNEFLNLIHAIAKHDLKTLMDFLEKMSIFEMDRSPLEKIPFTDKEYTDQKRGLIHLLLEDKGLLGAKLLKHFFDKNKTIKEMLTKNLDYDLFSKFCQTTQNQKLFLQLPEPTYLIQKLLRDSPVHLRNNYDLFDALSLGENGIAILDLLLSVNAKIIEDPYTGPIFPLLNLCEAQNGQQCLFKILENNQAFTLNSSQLNNPIYPLEPEVQAIVEDTSTHLEKLLEYETGRNILKTFIKNGQIKIDAKLPAETKKKLLALNDKELVTLLKPVTSSTVSMFAKKELNPHTEHLNIPDRSREYN